MGNTHSATLDHRHAPKVIVRKRSLPLSALTLGCTSAAYTPSVPSYHTYASHEEGSVSDRDEKRSFDPPPLYANSTPDLPEDGAATAYKEFLREYPQYQLTWILDALRRSDFARLDRSGETYVDYMGGSLYPESLIRVHTGFLHRNILGNTHSVSNSSKLSAACANEARQAVLSFFRAPPGYTVVFTANATGALKLVGEAFPFASGSSFVLGADSHNSVHGIRRFAQERGAQVYYIESTEHGGLRINDAKTILTQNRPRSHRASPSLFALTGQSNISNSKNPLSLVQYATSQGYFTLLDAAALAPTSVFSLTDTPVDAMAVSFYKMFGFPTGVGALVVKESFLALLERPWFAGGTVDVVQAPGTIVTMAAELHERFEDGTINYLNLPAITDGLRFLSAYLPFLPLRLSCLVSHLITSLSELKHDTTGTSVVRVLSRVPTRQLRAVGEQSDTGSVVSLLFLFPSGEMIPNTFVEYAASMQNISLRTGCMCNPGGAAALLGLCRAMASLPTDATLRAFEQHMGRELGVVRISLGLASDFRDVWRVLMFAETMACEQARNVMWEEWLGSKRGVAMPVLSIGSRFHPRLNLERILRPPVAWYHHSHGCSKFQEAPRPEEEEPERDMEFWYEDGSIVLIAGNVAFRVYQGLLSEQSSVFTDLFAIPQPAGAESIDGCPVVRLSDSPEDLRHLLLAIFKNRNFLPASIYPVDFNKASSLIRLGHKYDMEGVQESALALLNEHFTHKFEKWDVQNRKTPLRISGTQVIGAVNIARLVGADSILPSALYTCCQLGSEIMDGYQHEDGIVEHLTTEDIKRCLCARKELMEASASLAVLMWAGTRVSDNCTNAFCGRDLRRLGKLALLD
ncbi:Molybdenum cofactor sulfurase [Grifola frondosa]|uniref:Molybdenum cofactor sulfurase n=1 Tax=Grifola frondosa TaxID=5627 RepID=A0A1C7M3I1_GRIFR|nr:Molybdenum cofactor sulfurase [Grifola frondosa]